MVAIDIIAAFREGAAVLERPDVRTLAVTGPDRVRFLNGMVSNDVAALQEGQGMMAVKTSNRGRVEGLLRVRALKDSIKQRSDAIKPYMDRGNIGIAQDGLLAIRGTEGMSLKERADAKQLVDAENRDREALYAEIAKANNIPKENIPKIKSIFAKSWMEQARSGWLIQDSQGNWRKK